MRRWIPSIFLESQRLLAGVMALLLVLPVKGAWAAGDPRQEARTHFEQAEAAYAAEDYVTALAGYEQAHALFPAPAFLFNMAQCHRHLDAPKIALVLYQRYLDEAPEVQNREMVEGLIGEMEVAVAALPPEPRLLPSEDVLDDQEQVPIVAQAPSSKQIYEQWWFWTAAAVVVGGVATGVVLAGRPGAELPPASLGDIDLR